MSRRLTFDGTITAGNILTAIVLGVGIMVWGLRLEGLVNQNVFRLERNEALFAAGDASVTRAVDTLEQRILGQIGNVREDISELRSVLLSQNANGRPANGVNP